VSEEEESEEEEDDVEDVKQVSKKKPNIPSKLKNGFNSGNESDGQLMKKLEAKKSKRKSVKTDHYFNFADEGSDDDADGSSP
jgi:hypothetical protein